MKIKYINKINIFMIIIIFISLRLTDFNQTMTAMWVGPYLSAVINFDWLNFNLLVNMQEIQEFSKLSTSQMFQYHFTHTDNLVGYDYLAKGLVIALFVAKKIFFWMGDLEALQYLQYIIHISLSIITINLLDKKYQKVIFFFLYAINPLILWVANYPFYYFWQVIPSFIFVYWYLKKDISLLLLILFSIVFAYIYITRPTVLLLIILFYILFALKNSYKVSLLGFFIFFSLINLAPKLSIGPWHTAYIGIGAYSNPYNIHLDDEDGYKFYKEKTGKVVNSSNIMKKDVKEDYYKYLKIRLSQIVEKSPMMFVKNAVLNTIQAYSFGYSYSLYKKLGNKIIYISIVIGLIMMGLLIYTKQYELFLAIGFLSGSFTLYYPPIFTYMYGSFILLVIGFIGVVDYFLNQKESKV